MHRKRFKVVSRMIVGWLVGFAWVNGRSAVPTPLRYAISLEQVTSVVLLAHPEFAGDAIELAAPVLARESAPQLSAGSIEHGTVSSGNVGSAPEPVRLQMHCASREICLPFYVVVHVTGREAAIAATPASASRANHLAQSPAVADETKAATIAGNADEHPLLKSGSSVELVIDSGKLHLRLPAICMQGGREGATIRVRCAPRGLVFKAEILDQRTVRGSL
jgi:hypothetical protein